MKVPNTNPPEDIHFEIPDNSTHSPVGGYDIPNLGRFNLSVLLDVTISRANVIQKIEQILSQEGSTKIFPERAEGLRIDVPRRRIIAVALFNANDTKFRVMRLHAKSYSKSPAELDVILLNVISRAFTSPLGHF